MTARLQSPFGSILTLSAFYLPSPALLLTSVDLLFFRALVSRPREVEQKPAALQPSFYQILRFVLQSSALKQKPEKSAQQLDYWPVYMAMASALRVSVHLYFWMLGSNFLLFSKHLIYIYL